MVTAHNMIASVPLMLFSPLFPTNGKITKMPSTTKKVGRLLDTRKCVNIGIEKIFFFLSRFSRLTSANFTFNKPNIFCGYRFRWKASAFALKYYFFPSLFCLFPTHFFVRNVNINFFYFVCFHFEMNLSFVW